MNKSELIAAIAAKNPDLNSKAQTERIVNSLVETIVEEVAKGGEVALVGFGTFKQTKRAARTGKNPQTGKALKIPAKKVPVFKAGTAFKDKVNGAKK